MKVIGVGGQLGTGKDTLADYLATQLNRRYKIPVLWRRIGFAHAVKKVYMDTFGRDWEFIEQWKRRDEPPPGFTMNVRKALQFIGDGFRQIDPDVWIKRAFAEDVPKIISDLRYPRNEGKAVKDHGGINVLLWRPGFVNDDPNPSEAEIRPIADWYAGTGIEGRIDFEELMAAWPHDCQEPPPYANYFDFFIRNEGTQEDLYNKVDNLLVPFIEEFYGAVSGPGAT